MRQGICPPGWHVPLDSELINLTRVAINNLTCQPATGCPPAAANLRLGGSTGFNLLLTGVTYSSGITKDLFSTGLWSSNYYKQSGYGTRNLMSFIGDGDMVYRVVNARTDGFSIRCVKN